MSTVVNLAHVRTAKEKAAVDIARAARRLIQHSKAIIREQYPAMTEREVHQYLKRIAAAMHSQYMNRKPK